ncbi:hypothetical protein Q0590_25440 [Rhodocytophaga aerolata]|jgi:hypothetical protein|uniref:Uncharacterized protein n=1 Tax=Rhodocytophaga aerolata TaxID=455078 RepID=A0ABT8RC17_9BACT|nr:hypothetical protein [Rhodocytophaga aerolata]MDO1449647.1 hypothetical protein [Rhodocytophaga aerolata]
MNKSTLLRAKYYLAFVLLMLGIYVYAGLTGKRFTGSDASNWSPREQKGYHK